VLRNDDIVEHMKIIGKWEMIRSENIGHARRLEF
jgi:hypothetical protein